MQTLLELHPLFLVLLAGVAIIACFAMASTLQDGYRNIIQQVTMPTDKQRRLEEKRHLREQDKLQKERYEREQQEQQELRLVENERMRVEKNSIFLPRIEESCRLLDRTGTFSLILECLRAGHNCLSQENLKRLFKEHRDTILKTAVKLSISTKNSPKVKSDLQHLLTLLHQPEELAPLLLDCDRDVLLQSLPVENTGEFDSQMKSLVERKNKRIEAIQQTSIDALAKERLIEEIEMKFSDDIAKLVRDCPT